MEHRLSRLEKLAFPFRVDADGPAESDRAAHVRDKIIQVLMTMPGERVYRADFGAGVQRLVFEGNSTAVAVLTANRLRASLEPALAGDVDGKSIEIDVRPDPNAGERLLVEIRYTLASIGRPDTVLIGMGGT